MAATKSGRPQAVSREQILAAAAEIADEQGLDAISFRALGSRLGVSAMAVHRTVGGLDALHAALVSAIVGAAVPGVAWPGDWQGTVRVFATALRDLLLRHPLVLEAHRRAALRAPGADDVADRVVAALRGAGLDQERAVYGYAAVHDFVTGHVAIRLGRGEPQAPSVFLAHRDYERRFTVGLDLIIAGLDVAATTTPE